MDHTEKTIREWLEELPPGYRERALRNLDEQPLCDDSETHPSLKRALVEGFSWAETPEGVDFWVAVAMSVELTTIIMPPLPPDGSPRRIIIDGVVYIREDLA